MRPVGRRRTAIRSGSFALEAALAVQVLLIILLFFVAMLQTVRAEIRLRTAVDRAAAEISLLPPVVFALIDESALKIPVSDWISGAFSGKGSASGKGSGESSADSGDSVMGELSSQVRTGLLEIIAPDRLEALVNDAALDLTSSVLFSGLVNARIRHWQEQLGMTPWLGPPSAWLDWNLKDNQLFIEVDYEVRTLFGSRWRQCTAMVPIWRPQQAKETGEKESGDSVWQLDNFTRGRKLRERFGGNLPSSYPVIARFENGDAMAIKSMDLTRPTYADPEAVRRSVSTQLRELSAFQGTPKPFGRDGVWIQSADIRSRGLLLVVPADSDFDRYAGALAALTDEARSLGVRFETVSHANAKPAAKAP